MIAVRDFSGLRSSGWALASAPASAAMLSLERRMRSLLGQELERDGPGLGAPPAPPVADRLLRVPRDQRLELSLCSFVLDISLSGRPVDGRKLCPRVGPRHIDDAHRRDLGPWRLGPKQARLISALNAAPELLLGCDQQVLIQGIGRDAELHPFAAATNDREHRRLR